jgi:hypothetical protein
MGRVGGNPWWTRALAALLVTVCAVLAVTLGKAEASTDGDGEVRETRAASFEEVVHLPVAAVAPYQGSGEPTCDREPVDCLAALIDEMTAHVESLGCDHNAAFALLYLRTTEAIQDAVLGAGRYFDQPHFDDPAFLATEAYTFGRYYLDAFIAWEAGEDHRVPEAWRIAFEAADRKELLGFGNILLGINAHVNRDLPYVLRAVGLADDDGSSRYRDHKSVDAVLEAVAYDVRAEVAERLDPTVDPEMFTDPNLVPRWRAYAWDQAEVLTAHVTGLEGGSLEGSAAGPADDLETHAAATAAGFVAVTAYPEHAREDLVAARDAHCAEHRGG